MIGLGLARIVSALLDVYEVLIIAWCVISWIPLRPGGLLADVAQVLNRLVRPYLDVFRRFIPPLGGIDFSPVVAIIALSVIEMVVVRLIVWLL